MPHEPSRLGPFFLNVFIINKLKINTINFKRRQDRIRQKKKKVKI